MTKPLYDKLSVELRKFLELETPPSHRRAKTAAQNLLFELNRLNVPQAPGPTYLRILLAMKDYALETNFEIADHLSLDSRNVGSLMTKLCYDGYVAKDTARPYYANDLPHRHVRWMLTDLGKRAA